MFRGAGGPLYSKKKKTATTANIVFLVYHVLFFLPNLGAGWITLLCYCGRLLDRRELLFWCVTHVMRFSFLKLQIFSPTGVWPEHVIVLFIIAWKVAKPFVLVARLQWTLFWYKPCCFWNVNQKIIMLNSFNSFIRQSKVNFSLTAGQMLGCFPWNCKEDHYV